jgi:hypothetical protein
MGIQGPAGTGIQGAGVGTPKAAAVRAITMGLASLVHMPNGIIFRKGTISVMVPMGGLLNMRGMGKKFKAEGVMPKEHMAMAPVTTICAI